MHCPYCPHAETRVLDSRVIDDGRSIRRRRECIACSRRFTTYERFEETPLMVIKKKDGRREKFERRKVLDGIVVACQKRPISYQEMERIAAQVEQDLRNRGEAEVPAEAIGERVMELIRELDEVAYVRFASVYKEFKDIDTFMEELQEILRTRGPKGG